MPKIAVIGAGPAGLTAIKSCKEEGMDVVCFEKTSDFGGMWRYHESNSVGSVTKNTISLFSKEMNAYSDFPPPQDMPNYLHHSAMLDYLKLYAEHFKLLQHIRYQHEVTQVEQRKDYEESGRWIVKWNNISEQYMGEDIFDGVMVCTGRRNCPKVPQFPDQEIFRGKILHSKFLKSPQEFEDMRVLVVGFGSSAADAAVDISTVAKQVYLSIRNGRWVLPKVGKRGIPSDVQLLRRDLQFFQKYFYETTNNQLESLANSRFHHEKYKVKPNHKILTQCPTINEDLPDKILTARVIVKNEISRITEDGVMFQNEDDITKIDVIILATGYETKFFFLENRLWTTYKRDTNLYKYIFPLGLSHNTLAIIGHVQPMGPSVPVAESQCRWASLVFNKKVQLPTQEEMVEDVRTKISQKAQKFPNTSKQCPEVNYIDYMDELANQYGAKPSVLSLFIKDPVLYWACIFGPCLSYQYRLQGPNMSPKARDFILGFQERMLLPLNSKSIKPQKKSKESALAHPNYVIVVLLSILVLLTLF